jgi:hypothetical protein
MIEPAQGDTLPADIRLPVRMNDKITPQRTPLREATVEMVATAWQAIQETG